MNPHFWFFPPLLGLAGYLAAASWPGEPASPADGPGRAKERREVPARRDVDAALGEFKQQWAALEKEAAKEDPAMTVADLREKIAALKKSLDALTDDADWGTFEDLEMRLIAAAHELGRRQGAEAAAWIEAIDPDLRAAAMDGWAESEPDAAFKAIVASDRRGPCAPVTLMMLLQVKAGAGPAALKQACAQVPWELFRDLSNDPFGDNRLEIPKDGDIRPWIESGAALALARDGVRIDDLFSRWAGQDAGGALAQALDWPGSADSEVVEVLGVGIRDPQKYDEVRRSLEALPPEQLEKVAAAVAKYRENRSQWGDELASTYPMLVPDNEGGESP